MGPPTISRSDPAANPPLLQPGSTVELASQLVEILKTKGGLK